MRVMTLDEKLQAIQDAVDKAQGDPKKEESLLADIIDPADENACESCQ